MTEREGGREERERERNWMRTDISIKPCLKRKNAPIAEVETMKFHLPFSSAYFYYQLY